MSVLEPPDQTNTSAPQVDPGGTDNDQIPALEPLLPMVITRMRAKLAMRGAVVLPHKCSIAIKQIRVTNDDTKFVHEAPPGARPQRPRELAGRNAQPSRIARTHHPWFDNLIDIGTDSHAEKALR